MIPAPREEVFAAWLDPDGIASWMCPGEIVSSEAIIDARPGGRFRIVMKGRGASFEHTGEYQVVDPPAKLVFTWISKATGFQPSLVTVEFFDRDGHTEMVLTHQQLPEGPVVEQYRGGWGDILSKLAAHIR
jgi:uncharacterized protein YndB with AHSA1/START domain